MKTVLSIAGSDSGGGAGIQQDLKVFSAFGLHGASALTAVTAQNTLGVQKVFVLPVDVIEAQIDSVMSDFSPAAVKTGMLASSEIITLVRKKMQEYKVKNLVVDPVMVSTSGHLLLDEDAIAAMKKLIADATLCTPNLHEAEVLAGRGIKSEADMVAAAKKLGDCVVKGGHLNAVDILHYRGKIYRFPSREKKDFSIHGTGCAFSAAVSCGLALNMDVPAAVGAAKVFMDDVISRSFSPGAGLQLADTGGVMLSDSYEDAARKRVVADLETAVAAFLAYERAYLLVPQVGSNIAMALPGASSLSDVAGVSGRLVRCDKRVVPVGTIRFGGSSHVGRVVLTTMKFDSKMRAAMNIKYSDGIVSACKKLGFSVASFDRDAQPADTLVMECGTAEAIKAVGKVPDIIFDEGGISKEAMVRIIGEDAVYLVEKVRRIGDMLSP